MRKSHILLIMFTFFCVSNSFMFASETSQLIKDLGKKNKALEASDALAKIGKPVVPDLIKALGDKNKYKRRFAARTLGIIGLDASSAISSLLFLSGDSGNRGDSDVTTREFAIEALSNIERQYYDLFKPHVDSDDNRIFILEWRPEILSTAFKSIHNFDKNEGVRAKALTALTARDEYIENYNKKVDELRQKENDLRKKEEENKRVEQNIRILKIEQNNFLLLYGSILQHISENALLIEPRTKKQYLQELHLRYNDDWNDSIADLVADKKLNSEISKELDSLKQIILDIETDDIDILPKVEEEVVVVTFPNNHSALNNPDNTFIALFVIEDGLYQYINVMGSTSTVTQYKVVLPKRKQEIDITKGQ